MEPESLIIGYLDPLGQNRNCFNLCSNALFVAVASKVHLATYPSATSRPDAAQQYLGNFDRRCHLKTRLSARFSTPGTVVQNNWGGVWTATAYLLPRYTYIYIYVHIHTYDCTATNFRLDSNTLAGITFPPLPLGMTCPQALSQALLLSAASAAQARHNLGELLKPEH